MVLLFSCLRLPGQTCNDLSIVSLDTDCAVEVTPDMVLEGIPVDTSYIVHLTTLAGASIGTVLTAAHLGLTVRATVTDTLTGNSCWGLLQVEDHLAPTISCTNIAVPCVLPEYAPAYLSGALGLTAAYPLVGENCGVYTTTFSDTWFDLDCQDALDRSARLERVWTATDASGNQSSCVQNIHIERVHVNEVLFPADTVVSCSNPLTAPGFTGQPYYSAFGIDFPLYTGSTVCGLNIVYQDQVLPLCPGAYKILRTWTVLDDCLPTSSQAPLINPLQYIQVIKVLDQQGPVFQCPNDTVVSTDPFYCTRSLDLPDVLLTDACSGVESVRADWTINGLPYNLAGSLADFPGNNHWDPDTLGVLGMAQNLPAGIITIKYTAADQCGNTRTCSFRVTVSDGIVPWAVCDEFTQVALGSNGMALVHAATFDDGSGDNCSPVYFKARRVDPNPCQTNDRFHDDVKFCCEDVNDTIAVIFRVYDLPVDTGSVSLTEMENHSSDCLVQVFVEDKQKPVCLPPLNLSVSCLSFDPSLTAYGSPSCADNCCLDTCYALPPNYSLFDTMCNRGTILRTFRAYDCHGLSSQCTQRLIVNYDQYYWIKFPDDVFVFDCDTTGVYSPGPQIFGEDCELIATSYQDNVSTAGLLSCYWIERRWMVVDWCTYNPNLPLIDVPNPNPASDPLDPQNIPGPVVAPKGSTPKPTVTRITSNDPEPTDYSIFWAANANGYLYRQIISVRDIVPPKIRGCPIVTEPIEFCDHSDNDPQYWNAPYWVNPHVANSNDLCEGPVSLAVTASDGCSKGNINIRYFLFLDLDGDGVQETVINSLNPPPVNTVYYGNALTPNFSGGQPRAFDQRPVPQDEKYRFTIQKAGYVNVTGYVRWVTEKDPTVYVMPQLPHGNHRIQWIVDDGCGNEVICEYPIQVRDCHVPNLICLNGLSVDISVDQSITLSVNDFLWYAGDNCTPADQLQIGLQKAASGNVFPLLSDELPQQSVTYTCAELGTQTVEIWARDGAGNANVCQTYVIVQDNFGFCPATQGTVSGTLKTEDGKGLEDASVELSSTHPALPPSGLFGLSDQSGLFRFYNALPFGANLTLTPLKDNDPLNGVSTFDLVLINKHILGLAPLNSPFKIIAADANGSRSVTTFDIVELRKLILGIYTELPNNTSWRFVDKNYQFPNPYNPFQEIYPETREVADLQSSMLDEDFVAIKVGDVNGNVVTNSLQDASDRSAGTALFDVHSSVGDQLRAGEQFLVTISAAEHLLGFQFTLSFPGLDLLGVEPGAAMREDHFGVFPDEHILTTSWDGEDQPGFTLRFRARENGSLSRMLRISSRVTKAEAYRENETNALMAVALRFSGSEGPVVAGQGFELYANQPNPWHDHTQIRFYLPEAGITTLTVYDQSGKVLHRQSQWLDKGYQHLAVSAASLPDIPGVFYYRLDTETDSALGKMVRF